MQVVAAITQVQGWTVMRVRGELDLASAPHLRREVIGVLADGAHLVLDLTDVDFLDSTGLGVVLGALRRVRSAGGDLRLVCTAPHLLEVFGVTGLDRILSISASVDDAVAVAGTVR